MAFKNSDFKGIETFAIHALHYSYLLQVLHHLYVTIGCSVVKEGVVAVVSFVVFLGVAEQVEKGLVLVVPKSYHQRSTSVVVWFRRVAMIYQNL